MLLTSLPASFIDYTKNMQTSKIIKEDRRNDEMKVAKELAHLQII